MQEFNKFTVLHKIMAEAKFYVFYPKNKLRSESTLNPLLRIVSSSV